MPAPLMTNAVSPPLHLDIETYSECDLKAAGVFRYAEHPSTEVLCFSYAFGNESVRSWRPGQALPNDLVNHVIDGGLVVAHNAQFERVVLNGVAGEKLGFPTLAIEQMRCTAAKMAAHGLPRALGDAADALGSTHAKSNEGRITMLQLSKPRKRHPDGRYTPQNSSDKFRVLYDYCAQDVEAERAIDKLVPDLTESGLAVYQLDQLINERGIKADIDAIRDIQAVVAEYQDFLEATCQKLTADEVLDLPGIKPTQREKIAEWVRANGYPQLVDMQAETVRGLVADPAVPENVKKVLQIYSTYNMKAVTKYDAILDAVCADGRLRGMFLYHGANTGRWSSLIVQLQNLFRPVIEDPETAVEAFSSRSLGWIRTLYDGVDPMKVAASCVRSTLIAAPGKDLLFPDFAGIESRGCAWLFGEEWKLKMFREYDAGTGPDSYKVAYARSFQVDLKEVTKQRRQIGKVMELMLQYEGGAGAFVTGAENYSIDLADLARTVLGTLPPEVKDSAEWMWHEMPQHRAGLEHDVFVACDALKRLWRQSHPKIVQGWKDLKEAAELAVQFPGKTFMIPGDKIMFKVVDRWLYMRLPSGRKLAYFKPRWVPPTMRETVKNGRRVDVEVPGELRYWGVDTYTRQYKEITTYGGRLCENAVQALSRDLLVCGMSSLEQGGYTLVGSVHDEVICEIPEDFGSFEEAGKLMCTLPKWAEGLPVTVDGRRQKRYAK